MSGSKRGNPAWQKGGPSPNPTGRAKRSDGGWVNTISGFNVEGRDKRNATEFTPDVVSVEDALNLWRGDDIAARIVEDPINDAMREGFKVCIAADAEQAEVDNPAGVKIAPVPERRAARLLQKRITSAAEALDIRGVVATALKYERAYGGAAILLGVNDGAADPMEPLNLAAPNLKLEWLTVLEPREIAPVGWYNNPRAPKFGQPEHYQINPQNPGPSRDPKKKAIPPATAIVHESRLVVFGGIQVTRRPVAKTLTGWGDSVFTRVIRILRDFNASYDAAGVLVQDFAQAVFKMKGLAEIVSSDNAGKFKTRMELANYSRSALRAILIDAELEDFERKATPVTGLPELLDRIERRLAAATGMPLTRLMGMSPGGLNATGESDVRFYYDGCRSIQAEKASPAIRYILRILFFMLGGEPADWGIKFPPLWQESSKERAETRKLVAETDAIYYDRGIAEGDVIARSRWGGDEFSDDMQVDFDERDDLDEPYPDPEKVDPATLRDPAGKPATGPMGKAASGGGNVASITSAAAELIKQAVVGDIPKEAARALAEITLGMTPEQADRVFASVPDKPEAKPEPVAPPPVRPTPSSEPKP